jgi:hypothetical protein
MEYAQVGKEEGRYMAIVMKSCTLAELFLDLFLGELPCLGSQ